MENIPEAAPQGTEAAPQAAATESTKTEAPEINAEQVAKYFGTDAETLGKFQKFVEANGKFDSAFSKMKADISNPKPAEKPVEAPAEPQKPEAATQPEPAQPKFERPAGARTLEEINTRRYFEDLAAKPQYAAISKEIEDGSILKEMGSLGIVAVNPDYSINEDRLLQFLDLKAKTVPPKPTGAEPNASNAPTVDYVAVGDKIESLDQAYQVIMQPNHPRTKDAEEFIKNSYSNK